MSHNDNHEHRTHENFVSFSLFFNYNKPRLFNIADTIALLMVFGNMLHAQMLQCPRLILAPLVYEQRRLLGI